MCVCARGCMYVHVSSADLQQNMNDDNNDQQRQQERRLTALNSCYVYGAVALLKLMCTVHMYMGVCARV